MLLVETLGRVPFVLLRNLPRAENDDLISRTDLNEVTNFKNRFIRDQFE